MTGDGLPSAPGTYLLEIAITSHRCVQVGRLGRLDLTPGIYYYVGSALGPGGLAARVGRHLKASKKLRWHIDYLLEGQQITRVWTRMDHERREHRWARWFIRETNVIVPLRGIGASDCKCLSHFFRSRKGSISPGITKLIEASDD